jgi:signal transduction histidine kinase
MQAQIQTFIAHRTTMLAAISHDMRTPLTRIRLRGELIEDKEQQARLFRDVDEMQAMVDGALAFFRDDAIAEATTLRRVSWSRLELSRDADFECLRISHQSGSQSPPSRKSRTGGRGMEVG